MSHRQFQDEAGREWEAWDVYPSTVDVRLKAALPTNNGESTRRAQFPLPPELRDGWLAFQCCDESRRLAPIPAEWDRLSDRELTRLASAAHRVERRLGDSP